MTLHERVLSPNLPEPSGADLIQLSLVPVGGRMEGLARTNLPIAGSDDPIHFTISAFANLSIPDIDEHVAGLRDPRGCWCRWRAVDIESLDARSRFHARLDQRLQVGDVLRIRGGMVGEFNPDSQGPRMDRHLFERNLIA